MSFTTAKDILETVQQTYMNDPSASIYTDAKLLPLLKTAYGFLETSLEKNGIQCKNKVTDPVPIMVGVKNFPIPDDFMWPIAMDERLKDSSDLFIPMIQRRWTPSLLTTDKLIYWNWNFEVIEFLGANTDREVRLFYQKSFPTIQSVNSFILSKAEQYLSAKVAALAHLYISQNPTLAEPANQAAENNLDEILTIFIKKTQSMPVRRKPYIPFR